MTARQGTLWKTSWKRDRGTPEVPPSGPMAFFVTFDDGAGNVCEYRSPGDAALGVALPFWYGVVGISVPGATFRAGGAGGGGWVGRAFGTTTSPTTGTVDFNANINPALFFSEVNGSMPVPGLSFVSAALISVTKPGLTGYRVQTFFNSQDSEIFDVPVASYAPPLPGVPIQFLTGSGGIHGACGGPFAITVAEAVQWFADLKSSLSIQAIPGKTSHLYSAGAVFPAVPLLAFGVGQPLDLFTVSGVPTPANILTPVSFNW